MAGISFNVPTFQPIKVTEFPDNMKTLTSIMQMYARMQQMQLAQQRMALAQQRAATRTAGHTEFIPDLQNPGQLKPVTITGKDKDTRQQQREYYQQQELAQYLAKDAALQQKLAQLDTMDVGSAEKALGEIRQHVKQIGKSTGIDASTVLSNILKNPQAQVAERREAVKNDPVWNRVWQTAKAYFPTFAEGLQTIVSAETEQQKHERGQRALQRQAEARAASPYLEDQARRAAAGQGVLERGGGDLGSYLTNTANWAIEQTGSLGLPLALQFIPGVGPVASAIVGGVGMGVQSESDYLADIASQQELSEEQKLQATRGSTAAFGLGAALGAMRIPGERMLAPLTSRIPLLKNAPVTRGVGSYLARDVPTTALEGAILGGAGQFGQNVIFDINTPIDRPWGQNVVESAAHGAMAAPVFGAIRQFGRKPQPKTPTPGAEPPAPVVDEVQSGAAIPARPSEQLVIRGAHANELGRIFDAIPADKNTKIDSATLGNIRSAIDNFMAAGGTKEEFLTFLNQSAMRRGEFEKVADNLRVIDNITADSRAKSERLQSVLNKSELAAVLDNAVSVRDPKFVNLNRRLQEIIAKPEEGKPELTVQQKEAEVEKALRQFRAEGGTLKDAQNLSSQLLYSNAKLNSLAPIERFVERKLNKTVQGYLNDAIDKLRTEENKNNEASIQRQAQQGATLDATPESNPARDGSGTPGVANVVEPQLPGTASPDSPNLTGDSRVEIPAGDTVETAAARIAQEITGGDPATESGRTSRPTLPGNGPNETIESAVIKAGNPPVTGRTDSGPGGEQLGTAGQKPDTGPGSEGREIVGDQSNVQHDTATGTEQRTSGVEELRQMVETKPAETVQVSEDVLNFGEEPPLADAATRKATRDTFEAMRKEAEANGTEKELIPIQNQTLKQSRRKQQADAKLQGKETVTHQKAYERINAMPDNDVLTPFRDKKGNTNLTPEQARSLLYEGLMRESFGDQFRNKQQKDAVEWAHKNGISYVKMPEASFVNGPTSEATLIEGMPYDFWGKYFPNWAKTPLSQIHSIVEKWPYTDLPQSQKELTPGALSAKLDELQNASSEVYRHLLTDAMNKMPEIEFNEKMTTKEQGMVNDVYDRELQPIALNSEHVEAFNWAQKNGVNPFEMVLAKLKENESVSESLSNLPICGE